MSPQDEAVAVLLRLSASTLSELGRALSGGMLRHGFSPQALQSFAGSQAPAADAALRTLIAGGFTRATAGVLCRSLGLALSERDAAERGIDLILSGPEVAGTPVVDTKTTVLSLFEEANQEVLISSYVFHEAAEFFARLAEKHDEDPAFRVTFVVDLSHRRDSPAQPLSVRGSLFAADFRKRHWPGKRLPDIWHDPRYFNASESGGGVLHAKTVIIDRKTALITSENFTGAAQSRNIEAGVLVRHPRTAARLHAYFGGLIATGALVKCQP